MTNFLFLGSKITVDGDCSLQVKRRKAFDFEEKLQRKAMTNLDSILKSRHITLPTNVCIVQSYGLSNNHVQMWQLDRKEGWAVKNRYFELQCWKRLLRVPWSARRSNQSILDEINPGYSLEELVQMLKLQYFGLLMQRADSLERPWCWERLRAGREGGGRGWDVWMTSLAQWTWDWASSRR